MYATTEGVVRAPSALVAMVGRPPSIAATAELVVPRSMPTTCTIERVSARLNARYTPTKLAASDSSEELTFSART